MSDKTHQKPGQTATESGQYREHGPRGGQTNSNEITVVEGKTLPPTSRPGNIWVNVDPTKHKKK